MRRWLPRALAYLAFFLAAGLLFFLLGFPQARLDAAVNARLAAATGGALSVEGSRYRFPLSLAAERLWLTAGGKKVELGRLTLTPRILSLLGKAPSWSVLLSGGWGRLPVDLELEKGGLWKAATSGGLVDLARHPGLAGLPVDLSGKASPSLRLSGVKPSLEGAVGEGELLVTGAEVKGKLLEAFGLSPLALTRLQLPLALDKGILTLRDGRVEGGFSGTLSGTSRLAPARPSLSSLDLTLSLRPSPELRPRVGQLLPALGQPFVVRLTGTVGQPAYALNPAR